MTGIKCACCDEKIATIHCSENDDYYCADCFEEKESNYVPEHQSDCFE